MNSNNRIAGTLFPRGLVWLRDINTLHKVDDDNTSKYGDITEPRKQPNRALHIYCGRYL